MHPLANPNVASLALMFHENVKKFASQTLYMSKRNGQYRPLTYQQVGQIVSDLALGLASLGIQRNDKVAILCPTQEEWAMSDFAILSLAAVSVPIYPNLPPKQVEYILHNSDAKVVFCSDAEQLDKVVAVKANCPALTHAILISDEDKKTSWVLRFQELQDAGRTFGKSHPNHIEQAISTGTLNDLATIIYTSGTTGLPKGVMLSHGNLLSNLIAASKVLPFGDGEILLSFLPLSHIFERNPGHFLPVFNGCTIAYAENIEKVPQNLAEIRPTLMTAVPRLYEKMYAKVRDGLATAPPIRKKIFAWALRVGEEARVSEKKGFRYAIAHKLAYSKLHARLGGRIKFMVSGGAPLSKEIAEFFGNMGVVILEGYGLTETSPVITVNRPEKVKFGTVGPVVDPSIEVKILPDGEIVTRGPNVMLGYYKNDEATNEVLDSDRWFHTGDIGFLDEDGYLTITDRKKNLIVTSGGKNVAPAPIENTLMTVPYCEQVMVIGDKRNFISALVVPNFERLRAYAKEHNISESSDEQLITNSEIYKMVDELMQKAQDDAGFARYERVRRFAFLPKAFSIETGELTPSLKIKRHVVAGNFNTLIESIYNKETETTNEDKGKE